MKKTLVLGASVNEYRVSNTAIHQLLDTGNEVIAIGNRPGVVAGVPLRQDRPPIEDLDTVTLYLNPSRQPEYYDYILSLRPKRLIFNPGTENPELARLAREQGIEVEMACTLVMLSLGVY